MAATEQSSEIVALASCASLRGSRGEVHCLHAPEGGGVLLSGGADGCVRLWDLAAARTVREWRSPRTWTAA